MDQMSHVFRSTDPANDSCGGCSGHQVTGSQLAKLDEGLWQEHFAIFLHRGAAITTFFGFALVT